MRFAIAGTQEEMQTHALQNKARTSLCVAAATASSLVARRKEATDEAAKQWAIHQPRLRAVDSRLSACMRVQRCSVVAASWAKCDTPNEASWRPTADAKSCREFSGHCDPQRRLCAVLRHDEEIVCRPVPHCDRRTSQHCPQHAASLQSVEFVAQRHRHCLLRSLSASLCNARQRIRTRRAGKLRRLSLRQAGVLGDGGHDGAVRVEGKIVRSPALHVARIDSSACLDKKRNEEFTVHAIATGEHESTVVVAVDCRYVCSATQQQEDQLARPSQTRQQQGRKSFLVARFDWCSAVQQLACCLVVSHAHSVQGRSAVVINRHTIIRTAATTADLSGLLRHGLHNHTVARTAVVFLLCVALCRTRKCRCSRLHCHD